MDAAWAGTAAAATAVSVIAAAQMVETIFLIEFPLRLNLLLLTIANWQ